MEARAGAAGAGGRRRGRRALLHHVALGARDVETVAAFYRDLLGLTEISRHHEPGGRLRSVWLDLGGAVLMIERTRARRPLVRGVGAGPFLVAFTADAAERRGLERSLGEAGFPAESRTEHSAYFRDPEGNRIALSSYPLFKRT